MSNYKYLVKDTLGNVLRVFYSYKQAMTFKIAMGRYDWEIVSVKL